MLGIGLEKAQPVEEEGMADLLDLEVDNVHSLQDPEGRDTRSKNDLSVPRDWPPLRAKLRSPSLILLHAFLQPSSTARRTRDLFRVGTIIFQSG